MVEEKGRKQEFRTLSLARVVLRPHVRPVRARADADLLNLFLSSPLVTVCLALEQWDDGQSDEHSRPPTLGYHLERRPRTSSRNIP